jgi:hypothetical protein
MKKYVLFLFVSVLALASHGQSKITKESIIGNWGISSMEVKGMLYYDVSKDSIAISDSLKKVVAQTGMDVKNLEPLMKQQFAAFVTMSFSFDASGKGTFRMGLEAPQESKYTVDEAKSTITTIDKDGQSETMQAALVNGMLKLKMPDAQQEVWVALKKSK